MVRMKKSDIKKFLDEKADFYNTPAFITDDPVSIPHVFSKKEDIEISAFLTATISWGQRPVILKNASKLLQLMDQQPFEFVMQSGKAEKRKLLQFVHRTFNGSDTYYFTEALQRIYKEFGNLENLFKIKFIASGGNMQQTI